MKAWGRYLSNYLLSFAAFALVLLCVDVLAFVLTFSAAVSGEFGASSPARRLEEVAASCSAGGIDPQTAQALAQDRIWAMYLDEDGDCIWSAALPPEVPLHYSIQDVALFSRGYLEGYPVFVRRSGGGLLVLGYPKDSFMKLTSNSLPIPILRRIPYFAAGVLALDILLLFGAYCLSRRRIARSTGPIVAAIQTLSAGKPASLSIRGELSELAEGVNRASQILSRQDQARANWISGVSHDIRTPLSMILGYAQRLAGDPTASSRVRQEAGIIQRQSIRIKDLVQDLNLVSQLEYEMQPLHREQVRLSKLLRACAAELLNGGIEGTLLVEIPTEAEQAEAACDPRLLTRALCNLVQNSIQHNPQGCTIRMGLEAAEGEVVLTVTDDGVGLSEETLRELEARPHYLESTDERLDLRHGLGLILVRQIAAAHGGRMTLGRAAGGGCEARLYLPGV